MRTVVRIIALVLGLSLTQQAAAASRNFDPETAKILTQDAFTVSQGQTEIALAYLFGSIAQQFDSNGDLMDRPDLKTHTAALSVTHGFAERLDANITARGLRVSVDEASEVDDDVANLTVAVKWRFFESKTGKLALSWLPGFNAPLGPSTAQLDRITILPNFWSLDNGLTFTFVERRFNLSVDAGLALPIGSARDQRATIIIGNVAAGYQVTAWFQPILELNYGVDLIQGPDNNASILALTVGAVFNVSELFRLDIGLADGVVGKKQDDLRTLLLSAAFTF